MLKLRVAFCHSFRIARASGVAPPTSRPFSDIHDFFFEYLGGNLGDKYSRIFRLAAGGRPLEGRQGDKYSRIFQLALRTGRYGGRVGGAAAQQGRAHAADVSTSLYVAH